MFRRRTDYVEYWFIAFLCMGPDMKAFNVSDQKSLSFYLCKYICRSKMEKLDLLCIQPSCVFYALKELITVDMLLWTVEHLQYFYYMHITVFNVF